MSRSRHTSLNARKAFARMLSGGAVVPVDASDPTKHLSKLIISCRKTSALELELDHSGIRVTPDIAESVLARLDNAGMLACRFFEWARRQRHGGCAHTVRSYHTVVASLAKIRQYQLMWDVVAIMRREGVANVETFGIIMRKYARAQKVDEAVYTFNVMEKYGMSPNLAAFNSLLSALCKSKNVRKAQEIFDKMSSQFTPDAKTYSILLEGWGRAPNLPKMREVYSEMLDAGCQPDIVTYGIMVDALCKTRRVEEAVRVVQDMGSRGCQPTTFIYSVVVHTYGVEIRIEDAVATFLDMEKDRIVPDVVVYNVLVTAFCKVKKFENAFRVIDDMEGHGIAPNSRTWNIILSSLISLGKDDEAYRVFRSMIKRCQPDSDTYTMMIKMFCDNDKIEMALKVWKYMRMKQFLPSMHTFSVLINGLCDKGEVSQACVILEDMIEKGIRPPGSTFGKLRRLLLKEGRKDVLQFLVEKMKILINEPLSDLLPTSSNEGSDMLMHNSSIFKFHLSLCSQLVRKGDPTTPWPSHSLTAIRYLTGAVLPA